MTKEIFIEQFIALAKADPKICLTASHKGCGIYYWKKGEVCNLDCLAVASTSDNHWFGLGTDFKYYCFTPEEVV